MHLHCRPFQWPCGGVKTIHASLQHVQGYTGSHWTPPSGNYLLCNALAAARATANKTSIKNLPTLLAVSMAVVVQQYNIMRIALWRRFMAFLKATRRHHWVSTHSDSINWTCLLPCCVVYFIVNSSKKGLS